MNENDNDSADHRIALLNDRRIQNKLQRPHIATIQGPNHCHLCFKIVVILAVLSLATLSLSENSLGKWSDHLSSLLRRIDCQRCNSIRRPRLPPEGEAPHVVFDDLKYRRVCTSVYHSILCMIVRYPFEVQLQDPTVTYPKPIHDGFYNLTDLELMDWPQVWYNCSDDDENDNSNYSSPRRHVYDCMEQAARKFSETTVLASFTRQTSADAPAEWYGTGSPLQIERVENFFSQHIVLVLGASPTPYIGFAVSQLFEACNIDHAPYNYSCGSSSQPTFLRPLMYFPPINEANPSLFFDVNITGALIDTLLSELQQHVNIETAYDRKALRPLSILVDFPIAHTLNQKMIRDSLSQVQYNQAHFVELVMNVATPASRLRLAEQLGLDLQHVIAFDGIPHYYPTDSGAYPEDVINTKSEKEFLRGQGYDGWLPEYGSVCRGPLPPNSVMAQVTQLERIAFAKEGMFEADKWYGKLWEFSNQFWWQVPMWNEKGIDCTHPTTFYAGATTVHRLFLQAMIDAYYEG